MSKRICEIYISEKPFDIPCRLKQFAFVCEFLINKGINTFYVYSQDNHKTSVCIEILKLYKMVNPNIDIVNKKQKSSKKTENTVIFNWIDQPSIYDERFVKINCQNQLEECACAVKSEVDFSGIDLMA